MKSKKIQLTEVAIGKTTRFVYLNGKGGKCFNLGMLSDDPSRNEKVARELAEFLGVNFVEML